MVGQGLYPSDFIFIRHGETDWNREGRTMGQMDIPLNDLGRKQAKSAAEYLLDQPIKRIVHSPLSRAHETALILNQVLNLPIESDDDLKECGWGIQEGCLKGPSACTTESWVEGFTPEGAEKYIDFRNRAIRTISRIISAGIPTLIVSHGGLFWAMMDILGFRHRRLQNCVPVFFRSLPKPQDERWNVFSLDLSYRIDASYAQDETCKADHHRCPQSSC